MSSTRALAADPFADLATTVLTALREANFAELAGAFEGDQHTIVTAPAGVFHWRDRAAVETSFERWFGDADELAVTDFAFARIGERLHLRWRVSFAGGSIGPGRHVVEQQLYAELGPTGRIRSTAFVSSSVRGGNGGD
jgi:hypothetical protein